MPCRRLPATPSHSPYAAQAEQPLTRRNSRPTQPNHNMQSLWRRRKIYRKQSDANRNASRQAAPNINKADVGTFAREGPCNADTDLRFKKSSTNVDRLKHAMLNDDSTEFNRAIKCSDDNTPKWKDYIRGSATAD